MIKYDKELGVLEIEFGSHLKAGGRRYEIEAYRVKRAFRFGFWYQHSVRSYFSVTIHFFIFDISFCKWSSLWERR